MFLKVRPRCLFPLSIMYQARQMTMLDLVLEAEPDMTNKVKAGAELTFTAMSHI